MLRSIDNTGSIVFIMWYIDIPPHSQHKVVEVGWGKVGRG
jgi:hypothetical protein